MVAANSRETDRARSKPKNRRIERYGRLASKAYKEGDEAALDFYRRKVTDEIRANGWQNRTRRFLSAADAEVAFQIAIDKTIRLFDERKANWSTYCTSNINLYALKEAEVRGRIEGLSYTIPHLPWCNHISYCKAIRLGKTPTKEQIRGNEIYEKAVASRFLD